MSWDFIKRGDNKPAAKVEIIRYVEDSMSKLKRDGFKNLGKAKKGSTEAVASEIYSNIVNGDRKFILRYKNSKVYVNKEDADGEVTYWYGCDDKTGVLKFLDNVLTELKKGKQTKFYCRKTVKHQDGSKERVTYTIE